MSNDLNSEWGEAMVDLSNALSDFRDAGGDVFVLVGALQHFIHAICNQRAAILAESSSDTGAAR